MPPRQRAVWHGNAQESVELLHAVGRNCACRAVEGKTVSVCAAHQMLVDDQRAMDGLLFGRIIAAHLIEEEFTTSRRTPAHHSMNDGT
jgi:hypothetical protein